VARPTARARWFGFSGALVCCAYAAVGDSDRTASLLGGVIGVASCAALAVGARLYANTKPAAWNLITGASLAFMLGILVRPWALTRSGLEILSGEVFTLVGYALLFAGVLSWLRVAGGLDLHAGIDGFIVAVGALAPAVQYLAIPAASFDAGRPALVSWVVQLYPVIDILIIFLFINLVFSTAVELTSFRLVSLAAALLLLGDLGYALLYSVGELGGGRMMDLPFMAAYVCMGTAALHPDMRHMALIVSQPIQPWSAPRLALIIPALVASIVVLLDGARGRGAETFGVLVVAALVTAVLVRAVSAVHRLAETQRRWSYQATHDGLTALANRQRLVDRLDVQIADGRSPPPWLVYVDLDHFKLVNDHWGHGTGDLLLQEVARRLVAIAADRALVARTGGDEFAVAGRGPRADAVAIAEAVTAALRDPIELHGRELVSTGSVGVVAWAGQPSAEEMVRDADVAMYRAKDAGRGRWTLFDSSMRDDVEHRVDTEIELRRALRGEDLWVAYQPLVDMTDERVVGAEALIRWTRPDGVSISPGDLIAVAEATGMIGEIGAFVVRESIGQLASWRRDAVVDDAFAVSVNVSTAQLTDDTIVEVVRQALTDAQLPPRCLVLEVTESGLIADTERTAALLERFHEMGVGIAVDDFGTGYSSLSYLAGLPIDVLKIDRSFVMDLSRPRGAAIVNAVVIIAHSLSLQVTAEGIETREQYDSLTAMGVNKGQGWLWSAAMSGEEFAGSHLAKSAASPALNS
jgi:diguanylate cyclase (GGDEF)-like protein